MTDVIVAIATPPGEGAVGMVRLSGPKALAVAGAFVRPAAEAEPKRAVAARAFDGGDYLDTVVLVWHAGPRSPTGEDLVELTAHGSPYVLRRLVELAVRAGARPAEPGEFTRRAFLNGKLDLAQAEAVCGLIRSRTRLAHRAAAEALEGRLSRSVLDLRRGLVELLARLEVAIDHPDEDQPLVAASEAALALAPLARSLEELRRAGRTGRLALEGLKVALVGAPNAGKSSLLNALLGRERAIVLDQPGTTRDTLEEAADLGGLLCVLVDTAGLRSGALDAAESLGIERTRRAAERADVLVAVLDASRPLSEEDRRVLALAGGRAAVIALNKSDLPAALDLDGEGGDAERVRVSALKGEGLEPLASAVKRAAGLAAGEPEGLLAATARQLHALDAAASALAGAAGVLEEAREDFAETSAHHLRRALSPLDDLLGLDAPQDVLAEVFSKFCIGK